MTRDELDKCVEQDIEDIWLPLLKTNGQWDEAKIRAELHDLVFVLNQVGEVYDYITGGKLSKEMYYADTVKAAFDDAVQDAVQAEIQDALADAQ